MSNFTPPSYLTAQVAIILLFVVLIAIFIVYIYTQREIQKQLKRPDVPFEYRYYYVTKENNVIVVKKLNDLPTHPVQSDSYRDEVTRLVYVFNNKRWRLVTPTTDRHTSKNSTNYV